MDAGTIDLCPSFCVNFEIDTRGAGDGENEGLSIIAPAANRLVGTSLAQALNNTALCGELGFFLQRPQVFRAVAISSVRLWTLSRAELARMERDAPALCILVQRALLKSMSLSDSDLISDLAVM